MWLVNCRVIDVRTGGVLPAASISVKDGLIHRIEDGPAGTRDALDLHGLYVLPGLISCHTHLSAVYPFSAIDEAESPAATVLRASKRAREALRAGVTTVRCVHEQNQADLHLRRAAAAGLVEAPRIIAGGRAISTTGGHGRGFGCVYADGADDFLKAARNELAAGADHIKVFISGGLAGQHESYEDSEMMDSEMRSVVRAATEHRTYVVAHAGSSGPIRAGLEAGIKSFEHGYSLDDETAVMLRESGATLTPTLSVSRCPEWMRDHQFTDWQVEKAIAAGPGHLDSIRRAVRAGVVLIHGTDYPPGEPCEGTTVAVRELEFMVEANLAPIDSIRAATAQAAARCGIDAMVGAVEVGLAADLIAVAGNPLEDIGAMRDMRLVMQAGRIVEWTERR